MNNMGPAQKRISVVIPTHNRPEFLVSLLKQLRDQDTDPSVCQVIIVDDGSDQPVTGWIKPDDYPFEVEIHRHETNRARGAACNTGIKAASGEIIAILDDDISIPKDLLRLHDEFHRDPRNADSAAIGALEWGTGPEVTPTMYFLENSKKYFPLNPRILHDDLPYMTTANFSVRRDFILKNGLFDEDFKEYGYEDIELGERLRAKGLKMRFLTGANCQHHKIFHLNDVIKRQFVSGKMLALYYRKNSNGSSAITNSAVIRKLVKMPAGELNKKSAVLAGLEDMFETEKEDFWDLPAYDFYILKLSDVLGTYNCIGVVEGLKEQVPEFDRVFPLLLNSVMQTLDRHFEAALIEAVKADKVLPDFLPTQFQIASLLEEKGEMEEALKLLALLDSRYKRDLYVRLRLAGLKSIMGDVDGSMDICNEIISRPETNPLWRRRFAVLLIKVMLHHSRTDGAFQKALCFGKDYSSDPYLHYNIASLFQGREIFETAEDMFNSVLAWLDNREDCFEFRKLRSGIHYHLGSINLMKNRRREALLDFAQSLQFNVAHRDAARKVQELRSNIGLN